MHLPPNDEPDSPAASGSESFSNADLAVDRLVDLYETATRHIRDRFSSVLGGADLKRRVRAYYPEIRFSIDTHSRHDSRLAYGFVAGPDKYATTVTQPVLFHRYLSEQICHLIDNHGVPVEIGLSETPIPLHFAFPDNTHLGGVWNDDLERPLRDLFDVPDLAITDDAIVNGTYEAAAGEPSPLAPFTGPRIDYSLHRLRHYTATSASYFQNFILFTNYQFYVDANSASYAANTDRRRGRRWLRRPSSNPATT